MKQIHPVVFIGSVLVAIFCTALLLYAVVAHADPSYFGASNSNATTTVTYMTAGTATTTEVYDTGLTNPSAVDSSAFLFTFIGSSTASIANITFEYAHDTVGNCKVTPTACEWYSDDYLSVAGTTTPSLVIPLTNIRTYILPFASTTVGGLAGNGNGRNTRILNVPTPTRYVRAVITLPAGSLNGAVYAQFLGKKQIH